MTLPPDLAALRDEADAVTCWSWADFRGWKLGPGPDKAGPCPNCGGTDRFAIHTTKNTFNCRRCGLSGHGVIDLVMQTENLKFVPACELITGRLVADPVSAEEAAAIHQAAQRRERERAAEEDRRRLRAISEGHSIWNRTTAPGPVGSGGVADYLALRGIAGLQFADSAAGRASGIMLREIMAHDYVTEVSGADGRKSYPVIHSGPAMVAAVVLPDGSFGAVHQTWIDLRQANGKAALLHPTKTEKDGTPSPLPAKKVRGSKKGGAIKLYTPRSATRIVMGEGIETTLTALRHNFEPGTAYWAGVDLGNMAGRALIGFDNKRQEDEPNLDDAECFLPPDWCQELVYLCDSDEAATCTVEKATRGLKRAQALRAHARLANPELAELVCHLVEPIGDGKDLNDLVRVGGAQ